MVAVGNFKIRFLTFVTNTIVGTVGIVTSGHRITMVNVEGAFVIVGTPVFEFFFDRITVVANTIEGTDNVFTFTITTNIFINLAFIKVKARCC